MIITKKEIFVNFLWKYLEQSSVQIVRFIVSLLLARLLEPHDFGVISIMLVFINLANCIVQSGLAGALIQKKDADDTDFSTVFFMNLILSIVLYVAVFLISPFVEKFYNMPGLSYTLQVLGIVIFFYGLNNVQTTKAIKEMKFRKIFIASIVGAIGSAVFGIVMALNGFGIWSLVAQTVSSQIISTVIMWKMIDWHPQILFSWNRFYPLFNYGWKLLVSGVLDIVYNNLYTVVIGKTYSAESLAYFDRGRLFPQVIITNFNSSIQSVLFPVMSSYQEDYEHVKDILRKTMMITTFVVSPLLALLSGLAEPVVKLVLTDKWLPCVPFLQLACFSFSLWPIHTANLQAFTSLGRSDIFLKLEVVKKIYGILIMVITLPMGLMPMMIGVCVNEIISTFVNSWPNGKLLNYKYKDQIFDIVPAYVLSYVVGLSVYALTFVLKMPWHLFLIILFGLFEYLLLSFLFRMKSLLLVKSYLNQIRRSSN